MENLTQNNTADAGSTKEELVATVSWLILICLTGLAVMLDHFGLERQLLIVLVFGITVCKGKIVADIFMGLFAAPKLWRRLLTSYVVLVPAITAVLYLLS